MAMIGWLVVFVALVGIEVGTMALTTIWFAGGALAAFFMALAGLSFQVQMTVFLAVSFVLLIFTRPFAVKYVNKGTVRTNVDGLVGKKARVTGGDRQWLRLWNGCSQRSGMDGQGGEGRSGDP